MTPMQKLKNQFDELKSILEPLGFSELSLNKSSPSTAYSNFCGEHTVYEKKGVKSDFIKLFKIKLNNENFYNIGFAFKYLNLKDEDCKTIVSLKNGDKYFVSHEYSTVELRDILNNLLKQLNTTENLNYKKFIDLSIDNFSLLEQADIRKIRKKKMK